MKLSINHRTVFRYSDALQYAVQRLHLRPQSGPTQHVLSWRVDAPGRLLSAADGLGNASDTLTSPRDLCSLTVLAQGVVDTFGIEVFQETSRLSPLYYAGDQGAGTGLAQPHPRMSEWARAHVSGARAGPEGVLALAQAVSQRVRYRPGRTGVETDALEAFDWGWGVCQDQAHVMVALCRGLGWPARYVSGYFFDALAPELASHAWVDVCLDVAHQRWLSVDVTHACFTDERHVRLAVGRDYTQCSPTRGVRLGGGREEMQVVVAITAV